MEEVILTPDQVSQILQVHSFTVLKFIKQGKLKARSELAEGCYRIRRSDVDVFLDNLTQQPQSEPKALKGNKKKQDKVTEVSSKDISPGESVSHKRFS